MAGKHVIDILWIVHEAVPEHSHPSPEAVSEGQPGPGHLDGDLAPPRKQPFHVWSSKEAAVCHIEEVTERRLCAACSAIIAPTLRGQCRVRRTTGPIFPTPLKD